MSFFADTEAVAVVRVFLALKFKFAKISLQALLSFYFLASILGCGGYFKYELKTTGGDGSLSSTSAPCSTNAATTTPCVVNDTGLMVTNLVGASVTGWINPAGTTTVTADIPEGYYASQTVNFDEPELLAANIVSGVKIFGVTGNAVGLLGNCSSNGLQGTACTAPSTSYWTTMAGANISGVDGSAVLNVPAGYYDGTTTATATDSDLVSTNILSGVTVFGVTGSATAAYAPCTDEALNAGQCSTAASRYVYTTQNGGRSSNCAGGLNGSACWTNSTNQYVTGTLGGNITTWTNATSATTVDGTIPLGYYPGNTIAFTDADLLAANIKSGVSIFNVNGSLTPAYAACSEDTGTLNVSQCSTSANRYVSSASGSDVTVWLNTLGDTSVEATIPNGYYHTKQCQLTEANLISSNIRTGTSVFGVTGSVTPAYAGCSEDTGTLNVGQCSTSANRYVSSLSGSDITSWSNGDANTTVTATIPNGNYQSRSITFTEANLLSTNILSGVTVFGVAGSATAAYSPCTDEALNAGQCSTAASRYVYTTQNGGRSSNCTGGFNGSACWTNSTNQYVTGSLGGNITTWTNATSATTVDGTIPLGYYPGNTIAFTDADLLAANIKSGVSIFNVMGSYTGSGSGVTLMSNMHRDKATTQISQETEAITNSGSDYSNDNPGYRSVPDITKDDDGYTGGSVTLVSRTNWDTTCDATTGAGGGTANTVCKCGLSGTIDQRIADCAAHTVIGFNATWDGATKGNAGQGLWKLVTRTGDLTDTKGREVWRDERTKLLWSSLVATSLNWCKASGSNFITNNPRAQDDPNNYCDNATYQTTGIWSAGANKAISACYEDVDDSGASDFFTTTDAAIDNGGKGSLNRGSSPRVDWRLPTIYDFQQANVNGYRFVFPDIISPPNNEWSASVYSDVRAYAWIFSGAFGFVSVNDRFHSGAVRCVGR